LNKTIDVDAQMTDGVNDVSCDVTESSCCHGYALDDGVRLLVTLCGSTAERKRKGSGLV